MKDNSNKKISAAEKKRLASLDRKIERLQGKVAKAHAEYGGDLCGTETEAGYIGGTGTADRIFLEKQQAGQSAADDVVQRGRPVRRSLQ